MVLFVCYPNTMNVVLEESWRRLLSDEFNKEYFKQLTDFVKNEYTTHSVFPRPKDIFRALDCCPVDKVEVVILGQDPYHGEVQGRPQAQGLCFSVPLGYPLPPSLVNIFKELKDDTGGALRTNGDLSDWAKQGVLLLNATLTVRARNAGSHQGKGWERFTDAIIQKLSNEKNHIVFILWGSYARGKKQLIDQDKHYIIESPHPSPLSAHRGFFGSKPFSKTNTYLREKGFNEINWYGT